MIARFAPPLAVAALLALLQWRSGVEVSFFILAGFSYVVCACGRLVDEDPATAWVVGLLASCLAIYGLTALLPVTAGGAFGILAAAVLALEVAYRRRLRALDARAFAGFALAVAFTAAWSWEPAAAWQSVRTQGVLPLWSDYFFHGGLISQFGDPRALGQGSIYLAGHPPSFYHFASYAPAAALARLLDLPGLPLAASAWMPLGFLAMLAGGYVLGARLAGAAGGLAALVAIAVLPDASNYGLGNGWLSFHWSVIAVPGSTYALGASLVSLALLERWAAERSAAALAASALLALAAFFFRAHVFILLLPAWVAAALVCAVADPVRRRRLAWLMLGLLAIGAAAMSLLVSQLAEAGFWRLANPNAVGDFLWHLHTGQQPTAYDGVYVNLRTMDEPVFLLAAGIALAWAGALGAFLVALPAAALLARARGRLRPVDAAVAYLAFSWLLLMLFAPTPWHGDPTDLIHRPFVLLYAACAIWTFVLLLRGVRRPVWLPLLVVLAVALPALFARAGEMTRPKFRWGAPDSSVRLPQGLVEAAAYLRRNAAPGEIYAPAGLIAGYATFDLGTQASALSGVPAYLSRPYFESIKDAPRKALVQARLAVLQKVEALDDPAAALAALQAAGVRWYLVTGDAGPRWDPDRARAVFKSGRTALYRTP